MSPPSGLVSPPADVVAVASKIQQVSIKKSEPIVKKGTARKEVKLTAANYVRLEVAGEKGMFEYELKFDPPVDSRHERFKLVNQLKEVF